MCAQGFQDLLQQMQRQGVRLLVTSRCQLGCGLQGAEQLQLSSLSPEHAADLLRREAGETRATPDQAKQLAHICGCNALALMIIGGFIASQAVKAEVRWDIIHVIHGQSRLQPSMSSRLCCLSH